MKLVIDRSRWLRGESHSVLLRSADGAMCCLGFFGLACGVPRSEMAGEGTPEYLSNTRPDNRDDRWPSWLLQYIDEKGYSRDTQDSELLMQINDHLGLEDAEREQKIAAIFAKHGVHVEFVDGPEGQ